MTNDQVNTTLAALFAMLGAIFAGGYNKWLEWRQAKKKRKEEQSHVNRLHNIFTVYNIMENLVDNVAGIDRVLLLVGSNGGHEPRPGHLYHVSAVYGKKSYEEISDRQFIDRYEYVVPDAHYIQMLCKLLSEKEHVVLDVNELPDCKLRDFYLDEGIKFSMIFYLGHTKEELYFCAISSKQGPLDTVTIKAALVSAIDLMRSKFNHYTIKDK